MPLPETRPRAAAPRPLRACPAKVWLSLTRESLARESLADESLAYAGRTLP